MVFARTRYILKGARPAGLSDGDITSYAWEQLLDGGAPPVRLSNPAAVYPTFTAPTQPGDLRFQVTVTGPGGTGTAQVAVTVESVQQPELVGAQTAISAPRGATVTLDASAGKGISKFTWTRTGGPELTLKGADTAKPTLVVPLRRLPGQGAVANTATVLAPIVMRLDASGAAGKAAPVTVTITPQSDAPAVASAEFRTKTREWRISGSSKRPRRSAGGGRARVHDGRDAARVRGRRRHRRVGVPRHRARPEVRSIKSMSR